MGENGKKEIFKICPFNRNLLVGSYGTIIGVSNKNILETITSEEGYLKVKNPEKTCKNPREFEYVHRLVALTHHNDYTSHYCICHHIDGNKQNNRFENLEWVSEKKHWQLHRNNPTRNAA